MHTVNGKVSRMTIQSRSFYVPPRNFFAGIRKYMSCAKIFHRETINGNVSRWKSFANDIHFRIPAEKFCGAESTRLKYLNNVSNRRKTFQIVLLCAKTRNFSPAEHFPFTVVVDFVVGFSCVIIHF